MIDPSWWNFPLCNDFHRLFCCSFGNENVLILCSRLIRILKWFFSLYLKNGLRECQYDWNTWNKIFFHKVQWSKCPQQAVFFQFFSNPVGLCFCVSTIFSLIFGSQEMKAKRKTKLNQIIPQMISKYSKNNAQNVYMKNSQSPKHRIRALKIENTLHILFSYYTQVSQNEENINKYRTRQKRGKNENKE